MTSDYDKKSPILVEGLDTPLTIYGRDLVKVRDFHKLTIPWRVKCIVIAVFQVNCSQRLPGPLLIWNVISPICRIAFNLQFTTILKSTALCLPHQRF